MRCVFGKSLFYVALIFAILIGNYVFFFGFPDFSRFLVRPFEFTIPRDFHGTVVVSVMHESTGIKHAGVFQLTLDGNVKQRIIDHVVTDLQFNPSRNHLAYCESNALFVIDHEGHQTRIADFKGRPIWSPDGNWIVCSYFEFQPDSQGLPLPDTGKWTTWKCASDGTSKETLPVPNTSCVQDWSSDGRWLLIWNPKSRDFSLLDAHDLSTSAPLELRGVGEYLQYPRFSRNGKKLFYAGMDQSLTWTLYMRDLVFEEGKVTLGEHETTLFRGTSNLAVFDISPSLDDKFVAIALNRINVNRDFRGRLMLVRIADGKCDELKIEHGGPISGLTLR